MPVKIYHRHRWNVSYRQAIRIQDRLRKKVQLHSRLNKLNYIAGCDLAFSKDGKNAIAGVIIYRWPDLFEVERAVVKTRSIFPYIPGLLAFREAPTLVKVIKKLKTIPDLYIFDGQGIAHPRGMGIATHMGLLLNKPTIGCAKSRLCGTYREPAKRAGSYQPLIYKGKKIGLVLRTRTGVRPVFVSPGHKIQLKSAVQIILHCIDGYRIPKPTREADHLVESVKRSREGKSSF